MKAVHVIAFILLVIGGLNWGLVGVGAGDIVTRLLGEGVAQIVFVIVGLAAIIEVVTHKKCCNVCVTKETSGAVAV